MTFYQLPPLSEQKKFYYFTWYPLSSPERMLIGFGYGTIEKHFDRISSRPFFRGEIFARTFDQSDLANGRYTLQCVYYEDAVEANVKIVIPDTMRGYDFKFTDPFTVTCNGAVIFKLQDPELITHITTKLLTS